MSQVDENRPDVAARLLQVIEAVGGLPERDRASAADLVRVGEYQIALENLLTQAYEYEVVPEAEVLAEIRELAHLLSVADRYWSILAPGARG